MLLRKSICFRVFFIGLFLSIFFYSFSSPWSNSFGIYELLVFIFLVVSFWLGVVLSVNLKLMNVFYWLIFFVLFVIGFLGNDFQDLIRDAIPYFYLGIPLFFMGFMRLNSCGYKTIYSEQLGKWIKLLVFFVAGLGLIFSLRELFPFFLNYNFNLYDAVKHRLVTHDQLYLFQAPSVVFAAVFFSTLGVSLIKTNVLKSIGLIFVGFIVISAPFLGVLRGPVLFFFLSLLFFIFIFSKNKLLIVILLSALIVLNLDLLSDVFKLLLLKHQAVGSNNKLREFFEIMHHLNEQSFYNLLFGEGFGATYYSTGGGGIVRFAHSLPAYALIKGGIVLFTVSIWLIIFVLYKSLDRLLFFYKIKNYFAISVLLGFLSSFVINVFLEPGFKTLDFGLLLLIFVSYCFYVDKAFSKRQLEFIYKLKVDKK